MSYQLILRKEIREEIASAFNWHENKKVGLGEEFLDELERAFNLLQTKPKYFGFVNQHQRRLLLKNFPYRIIYEIFDNEVAIFTVRHSKQKDKS
jgi:plasmid stabilization system protein ParE